MNQKQVTAASAFPTEAPNGAQLTTLAQLSAAPDGSPGVERAEDQIYVPPGQGQLPVRRILVLVPRDAGLEAELAQRAWQLASPSGLPIVLLGLAQESAAEAQGRRQLASLAALTCGEGVAVTTDLALAEDWLLALRRVWQPGDLVLCVAGQMASAGWLGLRRQPLHRALQAQLRVPYYQARLSAAAGADLRLSRSLVAILAWLCAVLVVVGLLWVQMQVVRLTHGLTESALLLLSVAIEFALIKVIGDW